ncbi:MAG TPA: succinylglutamate desuccinylase [Rhodobiaceae bacterium]|nr:succinylglutamate desuccinylase [Rhodobiaceae bacterium]
MVRAAFEFCGTSIAPGARKTVDIPLGALSNHSPMTLPVHVIHGRRDGPTLFVSAAIHGDEVQGVEIIRRLIQGSALRGLRGTVMLIPIVNGYGFISHTRYLPDRRDLNRSFPGAPGGSLAGRLAHIFMTEIVKRSDVGLDLHTGALHRTNLPQIRADIEVGGCLELAQAFGAPVILHSNLRDGSLRGAAQEAGVDVLLYEAGEALRFDEFAIRAGVKGVLGVMKHLGMLSIKSGKARKTKSIISRSSHWLRASEGGIFRATRTIGDSVERGQVIGAIADPFGEADTEITARASGIIIGRTNVPVVNQGDALFHVAKVFNAEKAEDRVGALEQELDDDPLFDDDGLV